VLAQHDLGLALAHGRRIHDLVGAGVLEHAVLVDARLVGEGVAAHDGLVVLHRVAGEAGHQAAGLGQLLGLHVGVEQGAVGQGEVVRPGADGHDHLLQCGIAGPLADAVDGHLDLAGAGLHRGQRVGHREAEVVMAVGGDDVVAGDDLADLREAGGVLLGNAVADGVGDVQRGGAGIDGDPQHVAHEVEVRPGRVLWRELHVLGVPAGVGDSGGGLGLHLVGRHLQLVLHVRLAGRDEHVDPAAFGMLHGLPAPVDVGPGGAGEPGDDRPSHHLGDGLHGLEVALAGDREAGLDVVDPEARELLGDLELLSRVEGDAGRLLTVAQRGVEDDHRFSHGVVAFLGVVRGSGDRRVKKQETPWPGGTGGSASTGMGALALHKQEAGRRVRGQLAGLHNSHDRRTIPTIRQGPTSRAG